MAETTDDEFTEQRNGTKLIEVLLGAPKTVAICTMPGVMASVASIPRETAMFDLALHDMQDG